MSLAGLLAGKTPAPLGPASPPGLRDALLPDLPIDRTFYVNPSNVGDLEALVQAHWAQQTGPTRERLIEIVCAAGTYDVSPIKSFMCITRSESGDPADVIIAPPGQQGGVLHKYTGSMWVRGVTLRAIPTTGTGAKYPLHISGPGTLGMIDCNLEHTFPGSDGYPYSVGMDGFDGANIYFVGCTFGDLEGDATMNLHGGELGPNGVDMAFYDCHSGSGATSPVGFSAINGMRVDLWFHGGTIVPGGVEGDRTATHVDTWPAPVGGFANYERIQYGIT